MAVDFIQGKKPQASTALYNTPSQLFTPEVVTAKNIKAEIFDKKIQNWDQVCSGEYAAACHFEEGRGGDRVRYIRSVDPGEFWKFVEEGSREEGSPCR